MAPFSELQLQASCFQWAWNTYPETRGLLFHVTNEVKPHPPETDAHALARGCPIHLKYPGETFKELSIRIAKLKAAGLVPGVADLVFLWNRVWVWELKVGANTTSAEQDRFAEQVIAKGWTYCLCRDLATFQQQFLHAVTNQVQICQS